jgi:hypothetical protein
VVLATVTAQEPAKPAAQREPAAEWPAGPERQLPASAQYGQWARGQRPEGTVYGGVGPDLTEMQRPGIMSLENSGSLTGHILAQGRPDTAEESSGGSRTVVIVLVMVGLLIVLGLAGAVVVLSGILK